MIVVVAMTLIMDMTIAIVKIFTNAVRQYDNF